MKKRLVLAGLLFLAACYKPGQYPLPLRTQALDSMDSFRNYYLQGRLCDASLAFDQAVDLFTRLDDMCSISDAYIQRYLFSSYAGMANKSMIEKARDFGDIGNCGTELARILQIEEGTAPPDPSAKPNDIYRSVMLRRKAVDTRERGHIDEALAIDRQYGWILFTVIDLTILKEIVQDGAEKEKIQKRIDVLSGQLQKCD